MLKNETFSMVYVSEACEEMIARQGSISEADVYFHYVLYNIITPILFVCIIVAGTVGNLTVVAVILIKKKMRTPVNLLLLNLALADLAFLWLGVPFVTYHFTAAGWSLGDVMCKMSHYVLDFTGYVVVYTLVVIAATRYVMVVHWRNMATHVTCHVALVAIGCVWLVSLCANIPVLRLYQLKTFINPCSENIVMYNESSNSSRGRQSSEEDGSSNTAPVPYHYCGIGSLEAGRRINFVFFACAYALPLCVIGGLYCLITRYIRHHRHDSAYQHVGDNTSTEHNGVTRKRHLHAVRLLAVVVAVFVLSRLPLHAHLLVVYFNQTSQTSAHEIYRLVAHFLAYSNSLTNPIIYNYVSTDFQRSFKELYSLHNFRCRSKR